MGVDDHLLKGGHKVGSAQLPGLSQDNLHSPLSERFVKASPVAAASGMHKNPSSSVSFRELRADIRRLTSVINELLNVFSKAHEDIRAEPTAELASRIDKLVEQNEEIARALLLLLELHREHLPQISKHTRVSSELKLRKPARSMFTSTK